MSFDDDKVGKIMNNLLSNAFKFTESGGRVDVSLRTLTASADKDSETLEIKVADTGRGISDEDKKHVFERFYQADNQTENPFGGSGIGLNLVAEFVKLHEGTITVDDNPGGGTVFIIHLPVRKIEAEAMKQTDVSKTETAEAVEETTANNQKNETEHETEKGENGRYEVLIVDDNPDFLQFMTDTLKDKYHVRRAEDGKQALQAISEHHPDIILSDVMMPEMDGNELCSAVKNNPETAKIPFVLLTARMAQEQKISSLERGADDYITKPFDLDLLHLRIDNLIKWSHSGSKTAKLEPKVKELEITSLDEKLVNDATEYVEQNLTEVDLNVETLSAALNMSRSYLYKRILSLTGHTPSEFIRLIRLRHAEQLLRKSQLSVSEITYKVGFPNTRSFSKFFKEMYGILPSQYKDAHGV
jgi:DNA-binding response OmpR family regulator